MPDLSSVASETHPLFLSRADVLQRVFVKPPYYALRNERFANGLFIAEATAEFPQGRALGPMRPGEISRHAAIAGSCAAALSQIDDVARYYLASEAVYEGLVSTAVYGAAVKFEAEVTTLGKRRVGCSVKASTGGMPLARLRVVYSVLKPMIFERLNSHHRTITPYKEMMSWIGDYPTSFSGNTGVKTIPRLPISACAGHFENYPAAPVALLMDQLAQIAESQVAGPSYIEYGEVTATRLCWAGTAITFTMTKLTDEGGRARLAGSILSDDVEVGTMTVWLRY